MVLATGPPASYRGFAGEEIPIVLYVSFGVEKGGSTYTYCLIQAALEAAGHPHIQLNDDGTLAARPRLGRPMNNINHWDRSILSAAAASIPEERIVALRTHADPDPSILHAIDTGRAKLSIAVRDPRDLALSMLDVAARRIGVEPKPHWIPIEPGNLDSVLPAVERTVNRALMWMRPNATIFNYEETAFRPQLTLQRFSSQLNLPAFSDETCAALVKQAASKPYIKLNVGAPKRHTREMNAADQKKVLDRFPSFYDTFFPDADISLD